MSNNAARDLTDQRFGRWVAIRKVSTKGSAKWLCQCDCGNTKVVDGYTLTKGITKSCGCLRRKDLTNQRFGKLVVLKKVNTTGPAKWLCQCDCGNTKVIEANRLQKGTTRSCGCLRSRDLTNQRFGKLVAIRKVNITGQAKWLCQCDCGNTKEVRASNLLGGSTKNCGCLKNKDLTNQRFGKLIAIEKSNTKGNSKWLCQCDCGNMKEVSASSLLHGNTKSCGCVQKARTRDLTNQRFGKLVAIRKVNITGQAKWICQCDCGNMKEVLANSLLCGRAKSCGCIRNIDLTNQRFGKLTAIKKINENGLSRWLCQCDCGNMKEAYAYKLQNGSTKSCGCLLDPRIIDLTNRRIGRLVVLKRVNTTGQAKWLCQCDCGNIKEFTSSALLAGKTKSCGCLKKSKTHDLTNKRFGKLVAIRKIDIKGPSKWLCQCDCGNTKEVLAINLLIKHTRSCGECYWLLPTGTRFGRLVVLKKTTKKNNSGEYYYECQCDCGNITYVPSSQLKGGKTFSCGCYASEVRSSVAKKLIISRQKYKLDGVYTPSLTAKLSSRNTSGYSGVSYYKRKNRWVARITLKRKVYNLGSYINKEDAIKARRRAEEELFEPILEKYAELQKNNNE